MKACRFCHEPMPDKATHCPHCGKPQRALEQSIPFFTALLLIGAALLLGTVMVLWVFRG
jgi:uncharacterized paraquat-inducible protein A